MSRWTEHRWVVGARNRVDRLRPTPAGQLATALYEIQLRDRALTLAGQAFISLVPLMVVLATWISNADGAAVSGWLVDRFDLGGDAERAVLALFDRPPGRADGASLLSLAILVVSVNSFGRALQRTYEAAWGLPPRGRHRALRGAVGTLLLLAVIAGVVVTGALAGALPGGPLVGVPLQVAISVPGWWLLNRMLLNLRVGWRDTLPGAVVSSVALLATSWAGSVWVPILIEHDAARYGTVGVAVALISWLVVLAFVVVAAAVAGAWAARLVAGRDLSEQS